jgi:hypothetical protein
LNLIYGIVCLLCVDCVLASLRIAQADPGRWIPHFWGGSITINCSLDNISISLISPINKPPRAPRSGCVKWTKFMCFLATCLLLFIVFCFMFRIHSFDNWITTLALTVLVSSRKSPWRCHPKENPLGHRTQWRQIFQSVESRLCIK